jgi:hypothetical protein
MAFQKRSSKVLFVIIFTLLHMLLTALLFLISFSFTMSIADTDKSLPLIGEMFYRLSQIFQWPVMISLSRMGQLHNIPAYSGIFILFLNSLLWAVAILSIILGITKLRYQMSSGPAI